MKIENQCVVTVHYALSVVNDDSSETHVEKTTEQNPLVYLSGVNMMIPKFEFHMQGKSANDTFDFTLAPEDAYGMHNPDQIASLPIHIFLDKEGKFDAENIKVGTFVPMMDNNGNQHMGLVTKIGLENVDMDFNHPMAGKTLHFTGHIQDVRAATEEEISHGHVHGPGGHHH